ncbi:unnamed protein product (macronuclear) [Paramecium tetraurelia]|uniref:Uncharacterized protein n=1 Tax=Paramecium tetraurelia TaxID=5888 RepID=A0BK72_PARTE|nr:uncharacterized protein GSPATT00029569001 [Paramecium tetraurelia]CAK58939.1 unnamed protein product [Paramecium tetraurelia]|eukprot:XP_001426337.1 hypothetical protein (macronuclear) [Paramecium tetraurelia strain d4-2]
MILINIKLCKFNINQYLLNVTKSISHIRKNLFEKSQMGTTKHLKGMEYSRVQDIGQLMGVSLLITALSFKDYIINVVVLIN